MDITGGTLPQMYKLCSLSSSLEAEYSTWKPLQRGEIEEGPRTRQSDPQPRTGIAAAYCQVSAGHFMYVFPLQSCKVGIISFLYIRNLRLRRINSSKVTQCHSTGLVFELRLDARSLKDVSQRMFYASVSESTEGLLKHRCQRLGLVSLE